MAEFHAHFPAIGVPGKGVAGNLDAVDRGGGIDGGSVGKGGEGV